MSRIFPVWVTRADADRVVVVRLIRKSQLSSAALIYARLRNGKR
jgi:hypothetical protein